MLARLQSRNKLTNSLSSIMRVYLLSLQLSFLYLENPQPSILPGLNIMQEKASYSQFLFWNPQQWRQFQWDQFFCPLLLCFPSCPFSLPSFIIPFQFAVTLGL